MKRIKIATALAALLLPGASALFATDPSILPIVEKSGRKCYYYAVEKGESVYGITHKFGWDTQTFMTFNPEADELKGGQVVYYPCEPLEVKAASLQKAQPQVAAKDVSALLSAAQPDKGRVENKASELKQEIYTVSKGQSVKDVARASHMAVAQLFKANPGLTPDNLEEGVVLKVYPGADMMRAELRDVHEQVCIKQKPYKVKKKDTWQSIALKNKIDTIQLKKANPDVAFLEKGKRILIPQFKDTIAARWLPVIDPREETAAGIRDIYAETHRRLFKAAPGQTADELEITVLVSSNDVSGRRRDLEFLKGFMLGLQGKRYPDVKVKLRGVDLADFGNLEKALAKGEFDSSDIIICSVDKNFPINLVDYCRAREIMLFNVFDAKTDISTQLPCVVQLLPPSDYFYERTSDFLTRVMSDRIFLFVETNDNDSESIGAAVRERLKGSTSAKIVDLTDISELSSFDYDPTKSYTVISDAGTKDEISATLEALEATVDKYPNMPLSIVGRATWIVYASQHEKLFRKLDTYIPSRFIYDDDEQKTKNFESSFRSNYDAAPMRTIPMYSAMGYDVANYFIAQYIKHEGDLNMADPAEGLLQLDFRPERESMYDGFMNKCVYLLHFTPFSTTEKISL